MSRRGFRSATPHPIWEEAEQRWISDAEVAEVPFTAFTSRRKAEHVACRLIVRRVKRLQPLADDGTEQGELFAAYRPNAAWVSLAVLAFNVAPAAAVAAGMAKARWATLRTRIINVPARIASTGRRLVLHLPAHWPWTHAWQALHATATGPHSPATLTT